MNEVTTQYFILLLRYRKVEGKLTPGKVTQASQERTQEAGNTTHLYTSSAFLAKLHTFNILNFIKKIYGV